MPARKSGACRPVGLIILDGWGCAPAGPGNAISLARKPVWDSLLARFPNVLLEASGEAVGLPPGVMGNSEVGHLTLGSGRVIYQDLSRIDMAIRDGSFFTNPALTNAMDAAARRGGSVHLMGLLSDGRVHSSLDHVIALVKMAAERGVGQLYIHAFMDGRDTSPTAGEGFMADLELFLADRRLGKVATVAGRFYAMDRDRRWERLKLAYDALVHGRGLRAASGVSAMKEAYERGETDEFVLPTVVCGEPESRLRDEDAVIFFNFRPDRARELAGALTQTDFAEFDREGPPPAVDFVCFTEYSADLGLSVAFPKAEPRHVLAEVISEAGLSQLHIAETEKYAHVTFFFNGGREEPYPGEIRRLIPSPKDVETYDQRPEMSVFSVVDCFRETMADHRVDFVVLNFANPDMVGHTGNIRATVEAIEDVDTCLGEVLEVLGLHDARVMVTADHGNAEVMVAPDGSPDTAHSTDPVPLVLLEQGKVLRQGAGLSDVAPTVLTFLGLPIPPEMTGLPLCEA